jgi:hypothetical protein
MLSGMAKPSNARGPSDGFVRMTFDLEEDLRDELKVLSAMEKRAMGELLRTWTKQGIAALQKKHGRPQR